MFAQQPSTKVFAELFAKSDRLPTLAPAGASAFFFFLSFFFLCLYLQKEKAGLRLTSYKTAVDQKITSRKVTYDGKCIFYTPTDL